MAGKARKRVMFWMIAAASIRAASACKMRTSETNDSALRASQAADHDTSATANRPDAYETVNGGPQLSIDQNQFSFYWGLWRTLSPEEKSAIVASTAESGDPAGALVSRRTVAWNVYDCVTAAELVRNREELFYLDEVELNSRGEVVPLREAYRPGWRYFSMGTFDSTLARTDLAMPVVEQLPGERLRDWRNRKFEVEQKWRSEQTRRGQRGEIHFQASHRLYAVRPSSVAGAFISFQDYRTDDTRFRDGIFARINPSRWPVYFDERAHKPHSFDEPGIWRSGTAVSTHDFQAVLKWDWCDVSGKVKAVFETGQGGLPRPGPNRPGRDDRGNADIEIRPVSP